MTILSRDDLEFALKLAGEARPVAEAVLRAHISALEKERDDAFARTTAIKQELSDLGLAHNAAVDAFNAAKRGNLKALEEAQKALESQQAECHTLRRAFLHERHRADSAGAPPEHAYNARWAENLLADERKALVRARNEGLEKAAALFVTLEHDMEDEGDTDAARDARSWASLIRDMMEPE